MMTGELAMTSKPAITSELTMMSELAMIRATGYQNMKVIASYPRRLNTTARRLKEMIAQQYNRIMIRLTQL